MITCKPLSSLTACRSFPYCRTALMQLYRRLLLCVAAIPHVVRCFMHGPRGGPYMASPASHDDGVVNVVQAHTRRTWWAVLNNRTPGSRERSYNRVCCATRNSHAGQVDTREFLSRHPFIAVLHDVHLDRAIAVARSLHNGGFRMVSVTAHTPRFEQILRAIANDDLLQDMIFGVSSVTTPEEVELAAALDARFISSTYCDAAVVKRTKELGLISIPGVSTTAQATAAVEAGGDILKIFPVTSISPAVLRGMVKSMDSTVPFIVAGGIEVEDLESYSNCGASGFAVGRTLFKPLMSPVDIEAKATRFIRGGIRLQWMRPKAPVALESFKLTDLI